MTKKTEIDIRFPTDGTAKIVETVVIENLDAYGLTGDIELVIKQLQDLLEEGKEQGLTNIRLDGDYYTSGYIGETEKFWRTEVKGDKNVV